MEKSLCNEDLSRAKFSYVVKNIPPDKMTHLISGDVAPQPGDVVLGQIEWLGQHKRLELPSGRRAELHTKDKVVVCYGHRYAPEQFEAVVPDNLEVCHLVTSGGVLSQVLSQHSEIKPATQVRPIGLLADESGTPLNMANWPILGPVDGTAVPRVVVVAGTAMDAGKTTTAASLIRGLANAGVRVGAAKATGTGSGRDRWCMLDAGAVEALDFVDAGFPSTYRLSLPLLETIVSRILCHLAKCGAEFVILELSDGLLQDETAQLLSSPTIAGLISGVVFAATDAMGAAAGVDWLKSRGLPVLAVSGLLTASPLALREASLATGLPVLNKKALAKGEWLLDRLAARPLRAEKRPVIPNKLSTPTFSLPVQEL